jgi:hypothetical protein
MTDAGERADDLSWEQVTYRDPYADLQATDKDGLAKPPRSTSAIREAAMSIKKRQQFQKEMVEGEEQGGGEAERDAAEVGGEVDADAPARDRTALCIAFTLRS